ncbi:hypothetical protein QFC20_007871 [Naganishia adeliensis]|uniref:Uncharacterized protein n=1 Tax=Naganishia adeliensis TaxID=92952 RepID=A0ACC2UUR8_9TREE|nr:hypothetical protein QFC20_007871 [Naganishia adeliensis]
MQYEIDRELAMYGSVSPPGIPYGENDMVNIAPIGKVDCANPTSEDERQYREMMEDELLLAQPDFMQDISGMEWMRWASGGSLRRSVRQRRSKKTSGVLLSSKKHRGRRGWDVPSGLRALGMTKRGEAAKVAMTRWYVLFQFQPTYHGSTVSRN